MQGEEKKIDLSIGQLAKKTGVSTRSIRHYDLNGLLDSLRGLNGYRYFSDKSVAQVLQIKKFIALGFSLEEIKSFPGCMLAIVNAKPCEATSAGNQKKLLQIENEIQKLLKQRSELVVFLK